MARNKSTLRKFRQDALAIWDERFHSESEISRWQKFLRFCVLVVKSFYRNRCLVRASALTYSTLLALIPMLAVAIGITSSLFKNEGEDEIYRFVDRLVSIVVPPAPFTNGTPVTTTFLTNTPAGSTNAESAEAATNASTVAGDTNQPVAEAGTNSTIIAAPPMTNAPAVSADRERTAAQREAARSIHEFIQNTRHAKLGTLGVIFLILAGIFLLGQIESTLNDIWGVVHSRNLWSHVQIYCTAILVGPVLLAGAAALTSGPHLEATRRLIAKMPIVGPMIFPTLTLMVLWLTFALFYEFVPNTKVRFSAAVVGGVVGATVWHVNNLLGFIYISRVVSNGDIYGRLGLVPVFMLGIYFSWAIVLFGAQVSYAFQNRALYFQERLAENVNQRGREFVALRLMTCIGQRFQRGQRPQTSQEMSDELSVPSRLVQQVLQTLVAAHLVIEVSAPEPAYTPGRPLEQITAHHILQAMRARGQELMTRDEPVRQEVYGEFARIQEAEKTAASSITMLALVHRAEARAELAPAPEQTKEIELSPALVPKQTHKPESAPAPEQPGSVTQAEVPKTAEPTTTEPTAETKQTPIVTESPEAKPIETVAESKPIAEPIPDEEREFPL
jgi:membrane protein